jgi:hypothetical protein
MPDSAGYQCKWTCEYAAENLGQLLCFLPSCVLKKHVAEFLIFARPMDRVLVIFGGRSERLGRASGHLKDVAAFREDHWESLPSLPTSRVGAAATFDGDRFIITGGYAETSTPLRDVDILSIHKMQWEAGPPMGRGRYGHAAVSVDDWIYVVGGEHEGIPGSCERMNGTAWEPIDQMPFPVAGCRAVAIDQKIFVLGGVMLGWGPRRASTAVQVFDTKIRKWSAFPNSLKTGRAAFALHVLSERKLMLSGGFAVVDGLEKELETVEILGDDQTTPVLPSPRGGCQGLLHAESGRLLVLGGESPTKGEIKSDNLSLHTSEWNRNIIPCLSSGRTAFAACVGTLWPNQYHTAKLFTQFDF